MSEDQKSSMYLLVHLWVLRDDTAYQGIVSSFSRKHVTFSTRKQLQLGQQIKVSICKRDEGQDQCHRPLPMRVASVRPHGKEIFEVRAEFTEEQEQADTFENKNRRVNKRFETHLEGRYRMDHEKRWSLCEVRDVSSHGACLHTDRPLRDGCQIHLVILPKQGSAMPKTVKAELHVCRCLHKGHGEYEIGGWYRSVKIITDLRAELEEGAAQS